MAPLTGAPRLEIWSFNLRTEFQEKGDGPNGWSKRRAGVAGLIRSRRPAIVCTQEATGRMLDYLVSELGAEEYAWVGSSRRPGLDDERAGLLFDRNQLELLEHGTKWLAAQGAPPGQPGWDAQYPRTAEMALFRVLRAPWPARVRVVNTHFDHVGVEARVRSAELLADWAVRWRQERPDCAQIFCGDFNVAKAGPGALTYAALTMPPASLRDAAREARVPVGALPPSTIHKFKGVEFAELRGDGTVDLSVAGWPVPTSWQDAAHIDWLLWCDAVATGGPALRPMRYEVITSVLPDGRYPSDHFPVSALFELTAVDSTSPGHHQPRSAL